MALENLLKIIDYRYILILILFLLINIILYRNYIYNIFDQFLFSLIIMTFWSVTIMFLYINGYVHIKYTLQYFLNIFLFYIGIRTWKKEDNINKVYFNSNVRKVFIFISIILYLTTTLFLYIKVGSPALSGESRINFYKDYGIIKRIKDVSTSFYLYSLCIVTINSDSDYKKRKRYLFVILTVFFLIDALLSGAKSMILSLIFSYSFLIYLYNKKITKKEFKNLIKICVLISLFFIIYLGKDILAFIYDKFIIGFILRGDTIFIFYPKVDKIMEKVDFSYIQTVFGELLGILGLDSLITEKLSVMQKIYKVVYGYTYNGAPNAIFPVIGLMKFGYWGSLVYSYFLGVIISFIRFKLPTMLNVSWWYEIIIYCIVISSNSIFISITDFFGQLFLKLVFAIFLYLVSLIIAKAGTPKIKREREEVEF